MGFELSLAKGSIDLRTQPEIYLGLDSDQDKVFSLTGKGRWSVKKLDSASYENWVYCLPPILDYLIELLKKNNAPMGKDNFDLINHYFGITSYFISTLYSEQERLEDLVEEADIGSDFYQDTWKDIEYNDNFIAELEDLRQECIEYNKQHKAKKMLPMLYIMD